MQICETDPRFAISVLERSRKTLEACVGPEVIPSRAAIFLESLGKIRSYLAVFASPDAGEHQTKRDLYLLSESLIRSAAEIRTKALRSMPCIELRRIVALCTHTLVQADRVVESIEDEALRRTGLLLEGHAVVRNPPGCDYFERSADLDQDISDIASTDGANSGAALGFELGRCLELVAQYRQLDFGSGSRLPRLDESRQEEMRRRVLSRLL
jgi:hypothetical protein